MASSETSIDEWRAVLRGWRAELAAMADEHAFWRTEPDTATVDFSAQEIVLSADGTELARLPDSSGLGRAAARLDSSPFARDALLRLPQSEVLRADVWVPKMRTANLRQALQFELERLAPVDPSQLYFDFAIVGQEKATNRIEVALRIMRRTVVDEAVRACHAAGLAIAAMGFDGDIRPADWQQFPVDRNAHWRLVWRKWNLAFLGGLALALALAALLAWYGRNAEAQDMLADQIMVEQHRAMVVAHIEQEIDQTNARMGFLARQKQAPMTVGVLAELSRLLPDGTWLNEVEIGGGKVHIRGYSHAAADLIAIIDRSQAFANAQFGAPLIRNPTGNVEQFDIVMELARGKR